MKSFAVIALAAGLMALSCGRTELELDQAPPGPVGTGSAGTTGAAGRGAAGTTGVAGGGAAGTTGIAGRGAAGTTGVAGRGAAGTTGAAGRPGPTPTPIPCGARTCVAGKEKCCLDLMTGGPMGAACVPLPQACPAGPALECIDTPSCGAGRVCCVATSQPPSLSCQGVLECLKTPGLIVCGSDAECPLFPHNCCGVQGFKVCMPQPCGTGPVGLQP